MDMQEARTRAVAEIRRAAVTQSHAVRREMIRMADFFDHGAQLTSDGGEVLMEDVPIFMDGELHSHVRHIYTVGANRKPHVDTKMLFWDGEKIVEQESPLDEGQR